MHRCLKCNRIIADVAEISNGCSCGSKVFVFIKGKEEERPASPSGVFPPDTVKPSRLSMMEFGENGIGNGIPQSPSPGAAILPSHPPGPIDSASAELPPVVSGPDGAKRMAKHISNPIDSDSAQDAGGNAFQLGGAEPPLPSSIPSDDGARHEEVWLAKGGQVKSVAADGVENVRQVAKGVFELDVGGLSGGPLVVRDENGVYYVRLPFSQPDAKQ